MIFRVRGYAKLSIIINFHSEKNMVLLRLHYHCKKFEKQSQQNQTQVDVTVFNKQTH